MIDRSIIHVEGPPGGGKTALIEAILDSSEAWMLAARCSESEDVDDLVESAADNDPELERYRRAGAWGAARFRWPAGVDPADAFFMSDLMSDPSDAVLIEGAIPVEFADLRVFVAAAPPRGSRLFVRRTRNRAKEERRKAAAFARALDDPEAFAALLEAQLGGDFARLFGLRPDLLEQFRAPAREVLERRRRAPGPESVEHWAVNRRYAGIEHAQLAVITVRDEAERGRAEGLVAQLRRLREDDELFADILGARGSRVPVTAVAADLARPGDAGRRKVLARVKRALPGSVRRGRGG